LNCTFSIGINELSGACLVQENRESGEMPERAQRCEADAAANATGMIREGCGESDEAKSEDRPDAID